MQQLIAGKSCQEQHDFRTPVPPSFCPGTHESRGQRCVRSGLICPMPTSSSNAVTLSCASILWELLEESQGGETEEFSFQSLKNPPSFVSPGNLSLGSFKVELGDTFLPQ